MEALQNKTIAFNKRIAALVAGVSLLLMALVAGFSYGFVYNTLVIKGDAAATVANINSSIQLFRGGIAGWLIIFLTDIAVAWALFVFLKDVNKNLSLLMAWLRIAYTVFLGVAISNLLSALSLIEAKSAFATQLILADLNSFESIWSLGLIVFGIHLLLLGYLTVNSGNIPKIWALLLLFAGISYIFIHSSKLLLINYGNSLETIEMILATPMTLAEIGLAIWLLVRGGRLKN